MAAQPIGGGRVSTPLSMDAGALGMGDEEDARLAAEVAEKTGPLTELGLTGLRRAGGYVDEEFLPQLKGRKAISVFREMTDNDPIVGAMLFSIEQLLRDVQWPVIPAGKNAEDNNAAKLIETALDDMSHSFDDFITEALSMLSYGWAWHEIVYKRRMGPWQKDGRHKSKYTDGLYGWRKWPIRSQDTWQRWLFDEHGGTRGMVQLAPPTYRQTVLPIEKSLLFRFGSAKANPEGRSMLRRAYRPWFYKKRLEEFESIGVERDLAGLPKISVPASYLRARPGTDQYKMVQAFQRLVRSIRRNEQEGFVFPRSIDPDTKMDEFDFELLGGGGARQFNTREIIKDYKQDILMTVLADFLLVGHQQTGTYNLHVDKTGIFRTALNSITESIADVINRHAIPRLFAVNGWRPARLPRVAPSNVDAPDLTQLAQFLGTTAGLGFTWGPDADMEKWLRNIAGLPVLSEDDYTKRRTFARREEQTRFMEGQTRYLATKSTLAQTIAQEQLMAEGEMTPEMAGQQQAAQQGQEANQRENEAHRTNQTGAAIKQTTELAGFIAGGTGGGDKQKRANPSANGPQKP